MRRISFLWSLLFLAGCSDISRTITQGSYAGFTIGSSGPDAWESARAKVASGAFEPGVYADVYSPADPDRHYYYGGHLQKLSLQEAFDSLVLKPEGYPTRPSDSVWFVWTFGLGGSYYDNYLELHFRADTLFKMYRFRAKTGFL